MSAQDTGLESIEESQVVIASIDAEERPVEDSVVDVPVGGESFSGSSLEDLGVEAENDETEEEVLPALEGEALGRFGWRRTGASSTAVVA